MGPLPQPLAAVYRPATSREIRSWSFGQVKARRPVAGARWQDQRGTLDDQAIFGPLRDQECACGKYRGPRFRGMICDLCGVKVTSPDCRRQRFGHVELLAPLPHPLGEPTDSLSVFPVLPAAFVNSIAGRQLSGLYEELLEAGLSRDSSTVVVSRLLELLLPVAVLAHEWDLAGAPLLARGLALQPREELPLT